MYKKTTLTKLIKVNGYHRNAERVSSGISTQALIGEGKTVEETIEDFLGTFEAMKQDYISAGNEFEDVDIEFCYDTASFRTGHGPRNYPGAFCKNLHCR